MVQVFLDSRWYTSQPTGVGTYIREIANNQDDHEISLTAWGSNEKIFDNIRTLTIPVWKKKIYQGLWKTLSFPPLKEIQSYDLAHFTNGTVIPHQKKTSLLTVHDLAFCTFPETVESKNQKFLEKWVPYSLKTADSIIAVSEYTKEKIIEFFPENQDKIITIHNGIDTMFFEESGENLDILTELNINTPYFLSISTIEPRKDFDTQIYAYLKLPQSIRNEIGLVIVGSEGWKSEKTMQLLKKAQEKNQHIHWLGYQNQNVIQYLLQNALAYLHTSLEEGFGLGIVQALASKCPVIASDTSCHPEILNSYGTYFEVSNSGALYERMKHIIMHPPSEGEKIAGKKYAQKFSWGNTRKHTYDVYKKMM